MILFTFIDHCSLKQTGILNYIKKAFHWRDWITFLPFGCAFRSEAGSQRWFLTGVCEVWLSEGPWHSDPRNQGSLCDTQSAVKTHTALETDEWNRPVQSSCPWSDHRTSCVPAVRLIKRLAIPQIMEGMAQIKIPSVSITILFVKANAKSTVS